MDDSQVRHLRDVPYGLGQSLDLYEPMRSRRSVAILLWHGRGPNERDVMEPLASRIASRGVLAIVPDWNGGDGGRGRHHLSASLAFSRDLADSMDLSRVVLAGWSLGASAGLDVVRLCIALGGWRPDAFVGLSGDFDDSPYREPVLRPLAARPSVPLLLIHGSSDEVVPVGRSRSTFESLHSAGWDIVLREVDADHAGTIGTVYDPHRRRCIPSDEPVRQEQLTTISRWIADFACGVDGHPAPSTGGRRHRS